MDRPRERERRNRPSRFGQRPSGDQGPRDSGRDDRRDDRRDRRRSRSRSRSRGRRRSRSRDGKDDRRKRSRSGERGGGGSGEWNPYASKAPASSSKPDTSSSEQKPKSTVEIPKPKKNVVPGSDRTKAGHNVKLRVHGLHEGSYNAVILTFQLRDMFSKVGPVIGVDIPVNPTGRVRGFAYVDMDKSDADAACRELQGSQFDGNSIRIEYFTGEVGDKDYRFGGQKGKKRRGRGGGRGGGGGGRGGRRY